MKNKIIGVIGPKGSGKTYSVAEYMQQLDRVAVFDLVHESGYLKDDSITYVGAPQAFGQSLLLDKFCSLYRPIRFNVEGDKIECPFFNTFVKLCYLRGSMTMIIDEAHMLCNAHSCPPMLATANFIGRHRQLSIIYVAQSFSAVTRPLTRNTDEFWFWRIIEPSDLEGIAKRCGNETAQAVTQLQKLEFTDKGIVPGKMLKWDIWNGAQHET